MPIQSRISVLQEVFLLSFAAASLKVDAFSSNKLNKCCTKCFEMKKMLLFSFYKQLFTKKKKKKIVDFLLPTELIIHTGVKLFIRIFTLVHMSTVACRDRHRCPITGEAMSDPVMDPMGHNFERCAIERWLRSGHSSCPIGREALGQESLFPNRALREEIEELCGGPVPLPVLPDIVPPSAEEETIPMVAPPPHQERGVVIAAGEPPRGVKKIATAQQKQRMVQHVQSCRHVSCRSVWRGRWGSFIGGAEGSTHFDLTTCEVGKRLNQAIGWNYEIDDPAF